MRRVIGLSTLVVALSGGLALGAGLFPGDGRAPVQAGDYEGGSVALSARACAGCHAEIYDDWKASMHSAAWNDPQFQEIWRTTPAADATQCLNCHSPLARQQPQAGGKVNPSFQPTLQSEGVTCAACHVREGRIIGAGTSTTTPPHPITQMAGLAKDGACRGCHQQAMAGQEKGFYDTWREWSETSWAKRGVGCRDCHMPLKTGAVSVGVHRPYRSHDFRGAHSDVLLQRALTVTVTLDKPVYEAGDEVKAVITVKNSGAGHHVPSGDPAHQIRLVAGIADRRGEFLDKMETLFARRLPRRPPRVERSDTRLAAGESRAIKVTARYPGGLGEHYFIVQLNYDLMPPGEARALGIPAEVVGRVFDTQVIPITD